MNFTREKIKDFYLLDTKVENIFINEYMAAAPGDFVKVYLFALLYAEYEMPMTNEMMAKQLNLSEDKILKAWTYWEEMGAIKRNYVDKPGKFDFNIEFINLKELFYGKAAYRDESEAIEVEEEDIFNNPKIKDMFGEIEKDLSRGLSSTEIETITRWMVDYKATPEVICFGVKYCVQRNKTNIKYIETVISRWCEDGCNSVEAVKEHLDEVDQKYYRQKRVLKALGFTRNATEAEKTIIDCWFDQLNFNMDRVLEACEKTAGISNPNINYVNKVLENWSNDAKKKGNDVNKKNTVNQSVLNQYFEFLREKAEREAAERKAEVYAKLPFIEEIDEEIKRLSSKLSKTLILGTGNNEEGKNIKKEMDRLAADRAVALTENNYEMDYTDIRYACEKCNDTGITDIGEKCNCIKQRIEEAEVWQKKR
ncbi:MAG: DnaD domain protein [Eubacteriales bacterium]|nr:DnaD domain protein [Eubacteriales bacterium]